TVGPDFPGFREMDDIAVVGVAGPRDVFLAFSQGRTNRVNAGNKLAVLAQLIKHFLADTGHDVHVGYGVRGVTELHADVGDGRADGADDEGDDVHGASLHGTGEEAVQGVTQFCRVAPVVGGASINLF